MPPRLFGYAENALMPWNAPSNRPLTGPVVLAIVPILTALEVKPTSVPPVGQLLPDCPPTRVPPPVWVPVWPPLVTGPPATGPPPAAGPPPGIGAPGVATPLPGSSPLLA